MSLGDARYLLASVLFLAGPVRAEGETPTFVDDVAPIVYESCVPCHRPGSIGPFPLITYSDVRKRARQIAVVTETGFMPPWKPAPDFGEFRGVRRLEEGEKETLRAWAEAGAPAGDMERLPPPPEFEGGWLLGPPDLVLDMEEPFVVPAEGRDIYRSLVFYNDSEEGRWVRGLHVRPDNPRPVHHLVALIDSTDTLRALDEAEPGVGFEGMIAEEELYGNEVYAWGPGSTPRLFRDGVGWWLPAGADFVLSTHFQILGKPEPVRIRLGLYFADEPPRRPMTYLPLAAGPICIPPGEADYAVLHDYELPVPIELVSITPHAHYICREITATAELPDGETLKLVRIPDWDINWQDAYRYAEPIALPAGTRIRIRYVYDNSAMNDRNPFHPPRRVLSGPRSIDEMLLFWLQATVDDEHYPVLRQDLDEYHGKTLEHATVYEALLKGIVYGFDANGDETLDHEEDAAATAYMESLLEREHAKAFDFDESGELGEEERAFVERLIRIWKGEPLDFTNGRVPPVPPSVLDSE